MLAIKSVKTKILALSICAVVFTAMILVVVVLLGKAQLQKDVFEELDVLAQNETAKIAKDAWIMCRVSDEALQSKLKHNLNVARDIIQQRGGISFSEETVTWNAINQARALNGAQPRHSGCIAQVAHRQ